MSKRPVKSQASSSRVLTGAGFGGFGGFGGSSSQSTLSYLTEPADFSAISDAHVVVAFKNLSKKDQTTKAKALEDLRSYVLAHPYEKDGGVEEAILEAWVKSYPRISIENSRRVRELSHSIQSELIKSARKRMEKRLPRTVGAWLAGTYDRDRGVAKIAQDGLGEIFNTEDKILLFWKKCQTPILQFAQEAIKETSETLSDERNVSPDDAAAKYDRVIGASLSLVLNLLLKLDKEEISKHQADYDDILLNNSTLWGFASSKDPAVRRTLFQLLSTCIDKQRHVVENDLGTISTALIADGMKNSQAGSALQLVQALTRVTSEFPDIWTSSYKSKKSAISRLQTFMKKGSQGGVSEYWLSLTVLIKKLPSGFLPTDVDGSLEILDHLHDGIQSRDEVPANAPAAWMCYLQTTKILSSTLTTPEDPKYLNVSIYPMFEHFMRPSQQSSRWNLGSTALSTCAKAYTLCASINTTATRESLDGEWLRISEQLITDMLTSLPEQSKDFEKSQQAVANEAQRWFALEAEILRLGASSGEHSQAAKQSFTSTTEIIVRRAVEILSTRNGKPYSAASSLESALKSTPEIFKESPALLASVAKFLNDKLPKLMLSPSAKYLMAVLTLLRTRYSQEEETDKAWNSALDGVLSALKDANSAMAVKVLISDPVWGKSAQLNPGLQDLLVDAGIEAVHGDDKSLDLLKTALSSISMSDQSADALIEKILNYLSTGNSDGALKVLEVVAHEQPHLIQSGSTNYLTVLTKLLSLAETSDHEVKTRISAIKSVVEKGTTIATNKPTSESPIIHIIQQNLETAGIDSLSVDTLVQQAQTLSTDTTISVSQLFPSLTTWHKNLEGLLSLPPDPSLALTNPLGGAVFLVQSPMKLDSPPLPRALRDASGYSISFRMALYTLKTSMAGNSFEELPLDSQIGIMYWLLLTVQLAIDQFDLREKNKLWASLTDPSIDHEVKDFIASSKAFFEDHLTDIHGWDEAFNSVPLNNKPLSFIPGLIEKLLGSSSDLSPTSFYSARSLSYILHRISILHGSPEKPVADNWIKGTRVLSESSRSPFSATAVFCGLKLRTPATEFQTNRLISEIPGLELTDSKALSKLVLVSSALEANGLHELDEVFNIAKNRVVFAVKQIVSWFNETEDLHNNVAAVAATTLQGLFPYMQDTYGGYFENALVFCTDLWSQDFGDQRLQRKLPAIYATLKLVDVLKYMSYCPEGREHEQNEDLDEALRESKEAISHGLLHLLDLPRNGEETKAAKIVDTLICTKAVEIPLKHIPDISDIYSFVGSENQKVASAGYSILHRAIPAAQEQISADVILEKKDAHLPEELLSLLLDAPSVGQFTEEALSKFPSSIRTFLYAWLLVYDAFTTASPKVCTDYSEALKAGGYIEPLLNFLVEYLGHVDGDPINLTKEKFTEDHIRYPHVPSPDSDEEESQERYLQLALIHLYYLCLKFTPSLAKNWWIDCKSKQTRIAVESWTEKYFSPLVISDALDDVSAWAEAQEAPADDEKELVVKVAKNSRELYAGYEVDETQIQIAIRLPALYPLEGVKVDGINRVAVSEQKWQSWLMVTKGVIAFSGSITDGLSALRKNITGALQGQTECAICYSIISGDKKMPDKRCQTCKNLFHSACLFKWFNTSNQSSCPLCRNPFNYGARK